MFCLKCGIKFDDNSTFCPNCGEKSPSVENTDITPNETCEKPKATQKPFREDFYEFIKSFSFLLLVISASVYFTANVINSFFHFSSSEVAVSVVGCVYALVYLGLTVPSLWMLFLDRSPHTAFVPIKLCAFINFLKIFLVAAFGILTVVSIKSGKEEISHMILYLAEEDLSVYLVTLLAEATKSPSYMLVSTCSVVWLVYLLMSILYNTALTRLLNSTSKRINGKEVLPSGYKVLFSLSIVLCVMCFVCALSMYLFIKDDIYNVLTILFGGIFHMIMAVNLRSFRKMFQEEKEEVFAEEQNFEQ